MCCDGEVKKLVVSLCNIIVLCLLLPGLMTSVKELSSVNQLFASH